MPSKGDIISLVELYRIHERAWAALGLGNVSLLKPPTIHETTVGSGKVKPLSLAVDTDRMLAVTLFARFGLRSGLERSKR
jgi:hypothetical protein